MTIIPIKDLIQQAVDAAVPAAVEKRIQELTQSRGRISKAPPCKYCQSFSTNYRGFVKSSGKHRVWCFECKRSFVEEVVEGDRDEV